MNESTNNQSRASRLTEAIPALLPPQFRAVRRRPGKGPASDDHGYKNGVVPGSELGLASLPTGQPNMEHNETSRIIKDCPDVFDQEPIRASQMFGRSEMTFSDPVRRAQAREGQSRCGCG